MSDYTFISYAHENTRFVLKLARHLQKQGMAVWLDQWHARHGDDWERAITQAIRGCSHFLLVASPEAVNSWVVREQFLTAQESGKPVLLVLARPCQLPAALQHIPCINFAGRSYWTGLEQLLAHYFPNRAPQVRQWQTLTQLWRKSQENLGQWWQQTLLPLLWPGWLGPLILVALLAVTTSVFWSKDEVDFSGVPTPERLSVVLSTPTPPLLPTPVKTNIRAKDSQAMVLVPAGDFLMGSTESDSAANDDEKPQRPIYLDAFWIDKTEITNGQYGQCVTEGVCTPTQVRNKVFREANLPVVGVNWQQAATYCRWVGARLPTEAEWEKAARGPDGRRYPWGNSFDGERLNYCDSSCVADWRDLHGTDGFRYTAPVGSYPKGASPYGVLDMSGNVWEWTADWYAADTYTTASATNPVGPETGLQRVIRGGSWYYNGAGIRVARRHKDVPTSSYDNIGFRCVISNSEPVHWQEEKPRRLGSRLLVY